MSTAWKIFKGLAENTCKGKEKLLDKTSNYLRSRFVYRDNTTSMRGDAASNPARDTNFSFILETCRKSPVNYLHLYIIVSTAFLAQIVSVLLDFYTLSQT